MKTKHFLIMLFAACHFSAVARSNSNNGTGGSHKTAAAQQSLASACAEPTGATYLELNNVRALIQTGGDMWWDFISAKYEVPKNSGKTSIFAGSIWMAGVDVNGQLRVAAIEYRQGGTDYWTGPLDTSGSASVSAETCAQYDRHFKITRAEVDQFVAWWASGKTQPAGYSIPSSILDWPGNGDVTLKQAHVLAPYEDVDGDGTYNPADGGDYPRYDIKGTIDCRTDRSPKLYGDETLWWVYNDKGNIHTESHGEPIGMEVRAQAFAFATNDELNNMTFYNYELINRSTYTLKNTFFAQFADPDLGYSDDDYVGCDVVRGLGYDYNGTAVDGSGQPWAYGVQPPAVGIDFFEGPFQDPDGIDNPVGIGPNEALNGLGYGDGIIDNERFGMRRFIYFSRGFGPLQDPSTASDYYNYMQSIWKDGTHMVYGGNGHIPQPGNVPCAFMFPDISDPLNWGTNGVTEPRWSEETAGNVPFDRRFVQSAGPFTLEPGADNLITDGVVWARAVSGGPVGSVQKLFVADDKAQSFFENCFRVLNGPDAPDVAITELDRELILTLSNTKASNNYEENYSETDPLIPKQEVTIRTTDTLDSITGEHIIHTYHDTTNFALLGLRIYKFQGYQVFQVKDSTITTEQVHDPDVARLVAQCDIKDSISQIINYNFSDQLNTSVPEEEVNGENKGIRHSFQIQNDQFAQGDRRLVNFKKYYFLTIAYAFNKYQPFDPLAGTGQSKPYKSSRKSAQGAILISTGIPHAPSPGKGGTIQKSIYGMGPRLTRIEGRGNGGLALDFTAETVAEILSSPDNRAANPVYENSRGPVNIQVIDPLNVPNAQFTLTIASVSVFKIPPGVDSMLVHGVWVHQDTVIYRAVNNINYSINTASSDTIGWILKRNTPSTVPGDTLTIVTSQTSIKVGNEQLIPEWGLSVNIQQTVDPGKDPVNGNGYIESSMIFSDPSKAWLTGIPDVDGPTPQNWIRSGTSIDPNNANNDDFFSGSSLSPMWLDSGKFYQKILGGTWAPYRMASDQDSGAAPAWRISHGISYLQNVNSVDIIITSDQTKWSRCPVIELCEPGLPSEGLARKFDLRKHASVGKDGKPDNSGTMGMGWFPGYALNLETGERLNMMFGEDSWMIGQNGRDMIWNPTSKMFDNFNIFFGGKHYIYIMGHNGNTSSDCPLYDQGAYIYGKLSSNNFTPADPDKRAVYKDAMWVGLPLLVDNAQLLSSDVTIKLRMTKPYHQDLAPGWSVAAPQNNNNPMYTFGTGDLETINNDNNTAVNALKLINIIPNPYYAYSGYEINQLDNRVKFTNLPQKCTISIYTVSGTLIRQFKKDQPDTFLDWNLKNATNVPIASGVYIIHIKADGIGERVLKWFGVLRPIDLNSF